jgi:sugar (pentulose or hexulose) kinase
MPLLLAAAPDCGGVMALPFMDDEPGLGISRGGSALLTGITGSNATPGNLARAALQSVLFNLRCGTDRLASQGLPVTSAVLTGGLARTPACGQLVADTFGVPVSVPDGSSEGSALGAALLARFRHERRAGSLQSWAQFLGSHPRTRTMGFHPVPSAAQALGQRFLRHQQLIQAEPAIALATGG